MLAIEDLSQFVWSASLLFAGYLVVTVFVLPHPFFSSTTRYLDSQSWAGLQKQQWFSRLRASVRSLTKTRAMVVEGYEKVSTAENPCHDHDDISGDWLTLFVMHLVFEDGKELGPGSIPLRPYYNTPRSETTRSHGPLGRAARSSRSECKFFCAQILHGRGCRGRPSY